MFAWREVCPRIVLGRKHAYLSPATISTRIAEIGLKLVPKLRRFGAALLDSGKPIFWNLQIPDFVLVIDEQGI
jgi:hypothetical protein